MADFPALPLWTDAYLADCNHLNDGEHGRYLLLLMQMWRAPRCKIPNDDAWLAKRFSRSIEDVVFQFRPLIAEFCQTDGNWIFQKRLIKERNRVTRNSKSQSDRAKLRWEKEKLLYRGIAGSAMQPEPYPEPYPELDIKEDSPLSVPPKNGDGKPLEGHGKNGKSNRGTRWEQDQKVPEEWIQDAKDTLPALERRLNRKVIETVDVKLEAIEFANYWSSVPGAKGTKLDWQATWRNRIIYQAKRAPLKGNGHDRLSSR